MIVIIGLVIVLALVIYVAVQIDKNTNKKNQDNKDRYEEAIRSGDRMKALELGRKYYGSLRLTGRPTIYDEQAITNDLSTIKAKA